MRYMILAVLAVFAIGCTDTTVSRFQAYGNKHKIEMYSGGELIREWTSTGKVENEGESDGYTFRDEKSQRQVRVSGDVVITVLPE